VKWSRVAYCAALAALVTFLVMRGNTSLWFTVPLSAFAVWWTYICTTALWHVASFRIAVWRMHLLPPTTSVEDLNKPRKRKMFWRLADPKLDPAVNVATIVGVLLFPALLWLPLTYWLFG